MSNILSVTENNIVVSAKNGHCEILVNGKFYCSCDNEKEAREEINRLKQQLGC